jgi:hypothetical protein
MIPDNACCLFCGATDFVEEVDMNHNEDLVSGQIYLCKECIDIMSTVEDGGEIIVSIDTYDTSGEPLLKGVGRARTEVLE